MRPICPDLLLHQCFRGLWTALKLSLSFLVSVGRIIDCIWARHCRFRAALHIINTYDIWPLSYTALIIIKTSMFSFICRVTLGVVKHHWQQHASEQTSLARSNNGSRSVTLVCYSSEFILNIPRWLFCLLSKSETRARKGFKFGFFNVNKEQAFQFTDWYIYARLILTL